MSPGVSQTVGGRNKAWNLPNQITSARILLSLALFVVLHFDQYTVALVVFVLAASTDWVDGYVARRTGQVTQLGRILDPFADKVVICGAFIFLAAADSSQIRPWMAVVVVGRELLVTALRSFLEQHGKDFSATLSGKVKMFLQCAAAVAGILAARAMLLQDFVPLWLSATAWLLAWAAVLSTLYSGAAYIFAARRLVYALSDTH